VDVQEVRKLDAYLKRVFGNQKLRVVPRPKKDDSAEVYIGAKNLSACCSSMTKTMIARSSSRWRSWKKTSSITAEQAPCPAWRRRDQRKRCVGRRALCTTR
jgi:hypothetical protein